MRLWRRDSGAEDVKFFYYLLDRGDAGHAGGNFRLPYAEQGVALGGNCHAHKLAASDQVQI